MAHRAGAPGEAALGSARRASGGCDVGFAGGHIIAIVESINRAGGGAGFGAGQARLTAVTCRRVALPADCAAKGYKKPGFVMDQKPDW